MATITAICDPIFDRARTLAEPLGAKAFDTHHPVIERAEVVWICTPPATRRQPVLDAARAGRHIVMDKPIATTLDDGLAITEAAAGSSGISIVNFSQRFNWSCRKMKELVDS